MKENNTSCDDCRTVTSVRTRIKSFCTQRHLYELEWKMVLYSIGLILFLLVIMQSLAYTLLQTNERYITNLPWIAYLIITVGVIGGALWHIRAHKVQVSSMMGMMIGMILGMQTGVMVSVVFGSTNGMFIGSLVGLLSGLSVGMYAGRCCGLMGVLNGAIMGAMGGTMGPMIALMMKVDHIFWFMPLFTLVNILIVWGLNFLVFEEVVEGKKIEKKPSSVVMFFLSCISLIIIGVVIILYGYASAFATL